MLKFGECNPLPASSAANDDNTDVSMAADDELAANLAAISAAVLKAEVGAWLVSVGSAESSLTVGLLVVPDPLDIEIWVSVSMSLDARLSCS